MFFDQFAIDALLDQVNSLDDLTTAVVSRLYHASSQRTYIDKLTVSLDDYKQWIDTLTGTCDREILKQLQYDPRSKMIIIKGRATPLQNAFRLWIEGCMKDMASNLNVPGAPVLTRFILCAFRRCVLYDSFAGGLKVPDAALGYEKNYPIFVSEIGFGDSLEKLFWEATMWLKGTQGVTQLIFLIHVTQAQASDLEQINRFDSKSCSLSTLVLKNRHGLERFTASLYLCKLEDVISINDYHDIDIDRLNLKPAWTWTFWHGSDCRNNRKEQLQLVFDNATISLSLTTLKDALLLKLRAHHDWVRERDDNHRRWTIQDALQRILSGIRSIDGLSADVITELCSICRGRLYLEKFRVSPAAFLAWSKQLSKASSAVPPLEYDSRRQVIVIRNLVPQVHGAFTGCMHHYFHVMAGKLTADARDNDFPDILRAVSTKEFLLEGHFQHSQKLLDGGIVHTSQPFPMFVYEVGFNEPLMYLLWDATKWLKGTGGKTKQVIAIDIQESPPIFYKMEPSNWDLSDEEIKNLSLDDLTKRIIQWHASNKIPLLGACTATVYLWSRKMVEAINRFEDIRYAMLPYIRPRWCCVFPAMTGATPIKLERCERTSYGVGLSVTNVNFGLPLSSLQESLLTALDQYARHLARDRGRRKQQALLQRVI